VSDESAGPADDRTLLHRSFLSFEPDPRHGRSGTTGLALMGGTPGRRFVRRLRPLYLKS
jgi:hypothetical protein